MQFKHNSGSGNPKPIKNENKNIRTIKTGQPFDQLLNTNKAIILQN